MPTNITEKSEASTNGKLRSKIMQFIQFMREHLILLK